jgi:hypothetical protein
MLQPADAALCTGTFASWRKKLAATVSSSNGSWSLATVPAPPLPSTAVT